VTKDRPALRDYVFSMTLTHLVCFAIYLGFPVLGPWQFGSHGNVPVGLFFSLNAAVQQAGDSLGTACPSTHVAGSATVALVAWRRLPRPLAIALTVDAALIGLATVYTQNHYAFDVLTGVVVVLVLQGAAAPILRGRRIAIPRFTVKHVAIQPLTEGPLG
jgi:membrane-associated phospholipid phosphatase